GKGVVVKYEFEGKEGIRKVRQEEGEGIEGEKFNDGREDLYEAIEEGDDGVMYKLNRRDKECCRKKEVK
ncbi:catalase, partial [Bacillus altitudinis]|uniref:catalase n=1 Tax=Bacillus altitudinis TaxID=293387 RepID=UPI0011A96B53